ncbi:MAG: MltA domain-containing protein [Desulfovermiculus sp.]|nr:MltA domain-containing protein [Desulfovermiculus sp.]
MRHVARCWVLMGLAAFWVVFCMGCGPKEPDQTGLVPLPEKETKKLLQSLNSTGQGLPSWEDLAASIQRSLAALDARDGKQMLLQTPNLQLTVHDVQTSLRHMLTILPELGSDPNLLSREFACYELRPAPLFTGYYEPRLQASLQRMPGYPYPLYSRPKDLQRLDLGRFHPRWKGQNLVYRIEDNKVVPYHTRAEIDRYNALDGKAEVVAWLRDPVEAFFLHIQGSGQLELPDGRTTYVGYAGKNGHEYVSLGRVLVDRGHMDYAGLSMQSIQAFLEHNPELMPDILFTNPSYVFFELRADGPYGAMGQKLTPMVSLATDPSVIPLGALVAMEVDLPGDQSEDTLVGLGLAQDVGGAIKGRHVDLYCGSGHQAGRLAGRLKNRGRLVLLVSKSALPSANLK